MGGVVPSSFAPAIVVGSVYVLVLAEDGHTVLTSNEAVVEQAHLDEADAQSDTGSEASLISQAVALDPGFWFHLMTLHFAKAVEALKNVHYFQSPAWGHGSHVPPSRRFWRCEDQCEGFLSSLELVILLVDFHLAFAVSAQDDVVAACLLVDEARDAAANEVVAYSDRR